MSLYVVVCRCTLKSVLPVLRVLPNLDFALCDVCDVCDVHCGPCHGVLATKDVRCAHFQRLHLQMVRGKN